MMMLISTFQQLLLSVGELKFLTLPCIVSRNKDHHHHHFIHPLKLLPYLLRLPHLIWIITPHNTFLRVIWFGLNAPKDHLLGQLLLSTHYAKLLTLLLKLVFLILFALCFMATTTKEKGLLHSLMSPCFYFSSCKHFNIYLIFVIYHLQDYGWIKDGMIFPFAEYMDRSVCIFPW